MDKQNEDNLILCPYCKIETRLSKEGICCNCGVRLFRAVYEVYIGD